MSAGPDMGVVRRDALPLRSAASLDPLVERAGDARCVLLGAADHGTTEFHHWRAELTRRLIDEKGFSFLAVEDDWPLCAPLRRCVTHATAGTADGDRHLRRVLHEYRCWPTWPWANTEVLDFARWLGRHNARRPADDRVGVFGLDVYGLRATLPLVTAHVRAHAPEHLPNTVAASSLLAHCGYGPWPAGPPGPLVPARERDAMVASLVERYREQAAAVRADELAGFTASAHARGLLGAEHHYRTLTGGGAAAWNARERHLADTLDRLLALHDGRRPAKAVVWAPDLHVADARGTGMADLGLLTLGRLVRERYGPDRTVLTGSGAYRGTVTAADRWQGRAHVMEVPPARAGSLEDLLHHTLPLAAALFLVPHERYRPGWLRQPADHRNLGVVYRPEWRAGECYVPTVLGQGYDAFLYVDRGTALTPLHAEQQPYQEPSPDAV